MQDFLLLLSVLAIFVIGWFLMKRLDLYLDENQKAQIFLQEKVDILPDKDYNREEDLLAFVTEPIADDYISKNIPALAAGGNRWNCQDRMGMSYCMGPMVTCQMHRKEN